MSMSEQIPLYKCLCCSVQPYRKLVLSVPDRQLAKSNTSNTNSSVDYSLHTPHTPVNGSAREHSTTFFSNRDVQTIGQKTSAFPS